MSRADLAASNGVIHTISGVLEPLGLNHLYFRYLTGEYNCGQVGGLLETQVEEESSSDEPDPGERERRRRSKTIHHNERR